MVAAKLRRQKDGARLKEEPIRSFADVVDGKASQRGGIEGNIEILQWKGQKADGKDEEEISSFREIQNPRGLIRQENGSQLNEGKKDF
ncbi:hypothetical protein QYF36_019920 [Acer negundo]|nr:hypothetical protein QYF36_019920 [Acer negundo]